MVYINQHLSEQITLEKLAEIANMNKTYYSTFFKKLNKVTVWDYIISARIELAINYLMNSQVPKSIIEIAEACGFYNISNFNRIFKKITGKTPSEYKKKWK